jgi:hypothetical protein
VPEGYSGTPLAKKLGIKEGDNVALVSAPPGFEEELAGLPEGVELRRRTGAQAELIISFHTERAELEERVPTLLKVLDVNGGLWIAWPKKSSKVPTDITEDTLREIFLPLGLVDNKVCAITNVWSGLRMVWRKELRPRSNQRRLSSQG